VNRYAQARVGEVELLEFAARNQMRAEEAAEGVHDHFH